MKSFASIPIRSAVLFGTLVCALSLASCADDLVQTSPSPSAAPLPLPSPLIPAAQAEQTSLSGNFWNCTAWNDPDVHVHPSDSGWIMYLSRNTEDLYTDGRAEPVSLFSATSTDGITWTVNPAEILHLGSASEWDYNKVETPTVVQFGGQYHLYYSGGSQNDYPVSYKIGHATSTDGLVWTKDSAFNPVLSSASITAETPVAHVAEPGAVVFDGKIYLYFTVTCQRNDSSGYSAAMEIWLATSSDGSQFSTPAKVLGQGSLYPVSNAWLGYSTPSALVRNSKVELYYDVFRHTSGSISPDEQVALHRAVSTDGRNFTEDAAPLITKDSLSWACREIRGGSETANNDGSVTMWFSGDDYAVSGGQWSGGMTLGRTVFTPD